MKKIKSEKKLCLVCMEEHFVDTVEVVDSEIFKDMEDMVRANTLSMGAMVRRG